MNSQIRELIGAIDGGDFVKCVGICDTLIIQNPSNHILYEARGICLQRLMKTQEAAGDLLKSAELNSRALEEIKEKLGNLISIEEDLELEEQQESEDFREFVTPEIKSLHDEIEQRTEAPDFEPSPEVKYEPVFPEEEKKSIFRTPLFFIMSVLFFLAFFLFSVWWFILRQPSVDTAQITKPEDTAVKIQDKDTALSTVPSDTAPQQTETGQINETQEKTTESQDPKDITKQKQPPETTDKKEPETKQKENLPHTVGFFGRQNQFMLVEEKTGFYVQVGSFKDREKAENKLKFLENKGIKAEIYSVVLEDKGTFYRVRAGSFESPEVAKSIASKLQ